MRYAIYYIPSPDDNLYRFGSGLLGCDAFSGREIDQPADATETFDDWRELTSDPRKYGFHATLKAPITLADDKREAELVEAFERFAATPREIPTIAPVVRGIGGFIAVVPQAPVAALTRLADDCVRDFDGFRAPLTERDRERRLKSPLSERQIAHLDRWGYPYVFEDFRFHMTLTGHLASDRRDRVLAFLQQRFVRLDRASQRIDHLALLRQRDESSRFIMLKHARLAGL